MSKSLFAESVHGAMHRERQIPREDAVGTREGEGFQIFVTADGHGDKECIRSARGAELAVSVALDKLENFYHAVSESGIIEELFDGKKAESRVRKLIGSLIGAWNLAVAEDAKQEPFTEEELASAVKYGGFYREYKYVSHAYGTTLLAGLLTDEYLLMLHQGDGHCIVINGEGETVEPVPWDENCIDNVTASICDNDALSACRYAVIRTKEDDPVACFLASDGVDDSFFTMEETYAFCHRLAIMACEEDVPELQRKLSDILNQLSEKGSRDDTTISGFIDVERCSSFVKKFQQYDYRLQLENRLKRVEEKLISMSRKKAYLEEQAQRAMEKRNRCEERRNERKTAISELTEWVRQAKEGISQKEKEFEQFSEAVQSAREAEDKAISERDAYLDKYHQFEVEREELKKQISDSERENAEDHLKTGDAGERPDDRTEETVDEKQEIEETVYDMRLYSL